MHARKFDYNAQHNLRKLVIQLYCKDGEFMEEETLKPKCCLSTSFDLP